MTPVRSPARLVLADGRVFEGEGFGAPGAATGEVVFNTSMTGYQEALTDPSYRGQILVMTYPLQGNYGTNDFTNESREVQVRGFVVRELTDLPSHWRSERTLDDYLRAAAVTGIAEIDTRALVRRIREGGAQMGVLSTDPAQQDEAALVARARGDRGLEGRDLAAEVSCSDAYRWDEGRWQGIAGQVPRPERPTRCSCPTARATRRPWPACASTCDGWRKRSRCSASAWVTRSCPSRSAATRTS